MPSLPLSLLGSSGAPPQIHNTADQRYRHGQPSINRVSVEVRAPEYVLFVRSVGEERGRGCNATRSREPA